MDLFGNPIRDDAGQTYEQARLCRKQMVDNRAFEEPVLKYLKSCGPNGVTMERLMVHGVESGWWLDTARRHWGEKMRMLWSHGIVTIPSFPGETRLKNIIVVHPAFTSVTFQSEALQAIHQEVQQ